MRCCATVSIACLLGLLATAQAATYSPNAGDIIMQSVPHNPLVDMIEGATESPWSHCGVVIAAGSTLKVIEAGPKVRIVSLHEFTKRSRDGRWLVLRPTADAKTLASFAVALRTHLGKPYDSRYRMDDEAIYCSELIWKAWSKATGKTLGKPVKLRDLKWKPYQKLIKTLEGGSIPLDREIITPRDLAAAEGLTEVYRHPVDKPKARKKTSSR